MVRREQGPVLSDSADEVTHRAAVLGSPVAHSLSPVLHSAAYRALGLRGWSYQMVEVDVAGFRRHVAGLDGTWRGLSLTAPLKEVGLELADTASDVARATGAANTFVRAGAGWAADNTDVHGIVAALREKEVHRVGTALVIGSGATARSAVAALAELGGTRVTFMVRGEPRARTLAQAREAGLEVDVVPLGAWPQQVDVLVSTVPSEVTAAFAERITGPGRAVLEAVYSGGSSALMQAAGQRGYAVVPGTAMLLHQAGEQVRLMTGHCPPLEAMRAELEHALTRRAGS